MPLVLARKPGQSITVTHEETGDVLTLTVVELRPGRLALEFAGDEFDVQRSERGANRPDPRPGQ
ncbi:MAG TPA: carbon storage regulator [Gemmata sp.]|jgi:hypothetical protein|nr:carbon storage regulator [Gemmata sp.]